MDCFKKRIATGALIAAAGFAWSVPEMTDIGNPGNDVDKTGYGSVGYAYKIAKYETFISEWSLFYNSKNGKTGSFNSKYGRWNDGIRNAGDKAPAVYINFHQAAQYCNWLTTGHATNGAYSIGSSGEVTGINRTFRNKNGILYVLPTEDEWYKAAYFKNDASGYSRFAHGSDTVPALGGNDGWNLGTALPSPNFMWPVDRGGAEQNGTRNMMGNVYEWLEDIYGLARGGAYQNDVTNAGNALRLTGYDSSMEASIIGFRVVMLTEPPVVGAAGSENKADDFTGPAKYAWAEGVYPFEPDEYTLLLAGFEKHIDRADYAMGYTRFAGMGWLPREGYYGQAIDLDRSGFLHENFYEKSSSALPFYFNFGIPPLGNFNIYQGTLEFWFLLKEDSLGTLFSCDNGAHRISCALSPSELIITWPGTGRDVKGKAKFATPLAKEKWHYYTQTWSDGEFAVYIDGKLVFTHDMSDVVGLVHSRLDKAGIYIGEVPAGSAKPMRLSIDELAVSGVVRYVNDFEPPWKDGRRPSHALTGPSIKPQRFGRSEDSYIVAESLRPPVSDDLMTFSLAGGLTAVLDKNDGFIKEVSSGGQKISGETGGILIREGLERTPLFENVSASDIHTEGTVVSFRQQYGDSLIASSRITPKKDHTEWDVVLKNKATESRWLEVQFSLPLPFANIGEYFDGSLFHDDLHLPRRNDEFAKSVPFSAAGNGSEYAGAGLSSDIWVSDLVNEWVPLDDGKGVIRQGFKAVIDPDGEVQYRFLIFHGESPYSARKALERYYHADDQAFYLKNDKISVLMHLPCAYVMTQPHRAELPYGIDVSRRLFSGHGWRFEPHYGIKGDEAGIGPYFRSEKYLEMPEYEYAKVRWKNYTTIEAFRARQVSEARSSYLGNYTMHVRHWHPQTLNLLIIKDLYPEAFDPMGDKLQCGNKYSEAQIRACTVNTFNNPLYEWNKKQVDFFSELWGTWNKGFCHDTTYDCTARMIDPIARQTVGRSFSKDRGEYLRAAFGFAQHFQYLGTKQAGPHALAALGDGSYMSYMTAVTADKHLTEEMRFNDNMGYPGRFSSARIMAGEKSFDAPIGRLFSMDRSHTWLGDRFLELSEPELRNYYRYYFDQYQLHCFKYGVYLSALLTHGKHNQMEHRPLLTECVMAGWKVVPAVQVNDGLFAVRYGSGLNTFAVAGNHEPFAQTTDMTVDCKEIAGEGLLLFGDYFGGSLQQEFSEGSTVIKNLDVGKRNVRGVRSLGAVYGNGLRSAVIQYGGSGIEFDVRAALELTPGESMRFTPFLPDNYRIERITLDGKDLTPDENGSVAFTAAAGQAVLSVNYRNTVIRFDPAVWGKAELLTNDKAGIQVVIPAGATEMDKGTLEWMNHFIFAYDYADNVKGNLKPFPAAQGTSSFDGYIVTADLEPDDGPSVILDGSKFMIRGKDEFDRKKAMAVFMRLVDRKHIHIGNFLFPEDLNSFDSLKGYTDKKTASVLEKHQFHRKPLLKEEHDGLFQSDSLDFSGKYGMKFPPYIYEPGDWR